jgi:hypothetical protein
MDHDNVALELLMSEYKQIKLEQAQRIGFRDNMIFVQLAAVGSIGSWVLTNLEKPASIYVLLVIPWACVVLGWTYIVNDHAISRIGRYVREIVRQHVEKIDNFRDDTLPPADEAACAPGGFGWEIYHRLDHRRKARKSIQWVIDQLTFVAPGALGIVVFCYFRSWDICYIPLLAVLGAEVIALASLAFVITSYSDLGEK